MPAVFGPVRAPGLPPGTVACEHGAWSLDTDPRGLNVRAEPSTRARVLGRLPPPFRFPRASAEVGLKEGYRTEFRIIGYQKGWFLIEGAEPPGRQYETDGSYPRRHLRTYAGRSWIAASMVGANYAYGGTRMGGLFAEPREDAPWTPAKNNMKGEGETVARPSMIASATPASRQKMSWAGPNGGVEAKRLAAAVLGVLTGDRLSPAKYRDYEAPDQTGYLKANGRPVQDWRGIAPKNRDCPRREIAVMLDPSLMKAEPQVVTDIDKKNDRGSAREHRIVSGGAMHVEGNHSCRKSDQEPFGDHDRRVKQGNRAHRARSAQG